MVVDVKLDFQIHMHITQLALYNIWPKILTTKVLEKRREC